MATLYFNKGFKMLEDSKGRRFFFKNVHLQLSTKIIHEGNKVSILPPKEIGSIGSQMSV